MQYVEQTVRQTITEAGPEFPYPAANLLGIN